MVSVHTPDGIGAGTSSSEPHLSIEAMPSGADNVGARPHQLSYFEDIPHGRGFDPGSRMQPMVFSPWRLKMGFP